MGMVGKLVRLRFAVLTLGGHEFPKGERFRVSHLKKGKLTLAALKQMTSGEVVYLHGVPHSDIEVDADQPPELAT